VNKPSSKGAPRSPFKEGAIKRYILHHNKKVLDFQGLFLFLEVKKYSFHYFTFSNRLGLNLQLNDKLNIIDRLMLWCYNKARKAVVKNEGTLLYGLRETLPSGIFCGCKTLGAFT
jgi:hypothetical protein